LRGTLSAGLLYKRDPSFKLFRLTAMSDSTWADDPYDSCSTSGFVVKLNDGSLLHWGSRKQKSVKIPATPPTLSSPEAEFVAASDCSGSLVYLRNYKLWIRVLLRFSRWTIKALSSCLRLPLFSRGLSTSRSSFITSEPSTFLASSRFATSRPTSTRPTV